MVFNDGDFLKIEYTARRTSDKSVVLTTVEKIAKEEKVYDKDTKYAPQLVVVGKNSIIAGVDRAVKGMAVNESKTIEVEPGDGFGERREDLVSVMHLSDFREKDIDPRPGMQINLDGTIATVKSVNSGRVVVDANHPLAGERLLYDVKVVRKLENDSDKLVALSETYSLKAENTTIDKQTAKVAFGAAVKKDADYFINKSALVDAVFRYFDGVSKVVVDEEYERQKEKD